MNKPLYLVDHNRQPKHRVLDSDAVLRRYQEQYDNMPTKYALLPHSRVSIWRRAWRWLMSQIGY